MRRSAIAPTSAIATASASAASATGSAWKLPPETMLAVAVVAGEHQRVVGHRVRLAQQHQRGVAQLVEAGADHLRLAAQAVRILHAVVALEVRAADRAAGEQRAVVAARRRSARAGRAARGCAGRTGRRCRAPRRPSARRRRAPPRAPARTRSSACSASAVETCVPLISARPSLAASVSGAMPASRSAGAAGARSPSTSISPSPISASVRCASGARSPDAPTEPCAGMYGTRPALCTREQRVDHRLAHARVAAREARRLQREHQAHDRRRAAARRRRRCASGSGSAAARRARSASMRVLASLPKPVLTP